MEISHIEHTDVCKLQSDIPYLFTKQHAETKYEWFYFEITQEKNHIICILSLKDCFSVSKVTPASIYLNWRHEGKLIAYSYSLFENEEKNNLRDKIYHWIDDLSSQLEFLIPDHSLGKYIHLSLSLDLKNLNKALVQQKIVDAPKKHFWQLLLYGPKASGFIETLSLAQNFDLKNTLKRKSKFHDHIMFKSLSKRDPKRFIFEHADIYFDHNAGFEPLYHLKRGWYWWHIQKNASWEVAYYFPHAKQMYFSDKKSGEACSKIVHIQEEEVTNKKSRSFFGLAYPKNIKSNSFKEIVFNQKIESAPFYFRSIATGSASGTLEVLNPQKIKSSLNQTLMKARQIVILKDIKNIDNMQSFISFKEVCQKITKIHAKSFYIASHMLSKIEKEKAYFVYALCRIIDDATDEINPLNKNSEIGSRFSSELIHFLWSKDINPENAFIEKLKNKITSSLFSVINLDSVLCFIDESKKMIETSQLDKSYFLDLIDGQNMDENFIQPKSYEDLYLYCYKVAGVVGLMMANIFNAHKTQNAQDSAKSLGIAMQITNILRDIKEDYDRKRIYIPEILLNKYKLNNEQFFSNDSVYANSKQKIISELGKIAVDFFKLSIKGFAEIPSWRSKLCAKLMLCNYALILVYIKKNNLVVFEKRVAISKFKKIVVLFKVLLGFYPRKIFNPKLSSVNEARVDL